MHTAMFLASEAVAKLVLSAHARRPSMDRAARVGRVLLPLKLIINNNDTQLYNDDALYTSQLVSCSYGETADLLFEFCAVSCSSSRAW